MKSLHINPEGEVNRTKKCPQCEAILPYNQQKCPECGFEFPHHTKTCKFCKKEIPLSAKVCPHCGKDLIETMKCPECGSEISRFSFVCPECGAKLRDRKEPKGKSPNIYPQNLGENGPRSAIDEEDGKLIAIKINNVHDDYTKALEDGYEMFYITILASKEIAKFQFGEGNKDYSDEMIGLLLSTFNELMKVSAISYKEK
jgi:RNA polymerase subunit RPABC4/transcription elongation factor Spt4